MWLSTTWCDFLYRRRAMGMMWLFPHDVTCTSFGWEGRSFSLFDGLGWWRGAVAQGVPHFMLWSMRLTTHESGVVRGVVRGSFGGSFGCIFSTCFHLCSLFVPFLSSSLSFSQTVTSSLFIVSFVHSVLLLLKSNHVMQSSAGRRVVCSARGGLSRVCYNGTLYPSNEGNPLVFWWIAVTLLWPGRGDFSASGLSTFKKIALTSALDCTCAKCTKLRHLPHFTFTILLSGKDFW